MKRSIVCNNNQYKLTIPIELVRKFQLDKDNSVLIKEVNTSKGPGIVILKDDEVVEVEE